MRGSNPAKACALLVLLATGVACGGGGGAGALSAGPGAGPAGPGAALDDIYVNAIPQGWSDDAGRSFIWSDGECTRSAGWVPRCEFTGRESPPDETSFEVKGNFALRTIHVERVSRPPRASPDDPATLADHEKLSFDGEFVDRNTMALVLTPSGAKITVRRSDAMVGMVVDRDRTRVEGALVSVEEGSVSANLLSTDRGNFLRRIAPAAGPRNLTVQAGDLVVQHRGLRVTDVILVAAPAPAAAANAEQAPALVAPAENESVSDAQFRWNEEPNRVYVLNVKPVAGSTPPLPPELHVVTKGGQPVSMPVVAQPIGAQLRGGTDYEWFVDAYGPLASVDEAAKFVWDRLPPLALQPQTRSATRRFPTARFAPAGSLGTGRYSHTATLLKDGKVLVVGGEGPSAVLASAELYDPATRSFAAAENLATARSGHTATLLPNGKVLVAGGSAGGTSIAATELYDPATGSFSPTGSLGFARSRHSATLLLDGRVLVAGGSGAGGDLTSGELYDPAAESFTSTGNLGFGRSDHSATLLSDGQVLVVAGFGPAGAGAGGRLRSAERYDPATGVFASIGDLSVPRGAHMATRLADGKVLIAGGSLAGVTGVDSSLQSADLYDPATVRPRNRIVHRARAPGDRAVRCHRHPAPGRQRPRRGRARRERAARQRRAVQMRVQRRSRHDCA